MTKIKIGENQYPAALIGSMKDSKWGGRESVSITLSMSATQANDIFQTGLVWSLIEETELEDGTTETTEHDMSAYSVAGDITDHRDGSVTAKMGKITGVESANMSLTALVGAPIAPMRAIELRPVIEQAVESLSDNEAAQAVELFTTWTYPVNYIQGDRRAYNGKLYKCVQTHTSQELWTPNATPALWVVIDVEHTGTISDPIPASRGMEYEYGKYYLDTEDNKTYLCERTGEPAGGKVTLQYLPHELIGVYFTVT